NEDKYKQVIAQLCESLDKKIYLPYKDLIPRDVSHNLGTMKELFKIEITNAIEDLREYNIDQLGAEKPRCGKGLCNNPGVVRINPSSSFRLPTDLSMWLCAEHTDTPPESNVHSTENILERLIDDRDE
ncbi:unnamed protein product, partial [marine sediment metagenome]